MSALRVSLFGQFHVCCGDQDLTSLYPRRLQELLSYALMYRDRQHPREALASLLHPDSSTAQAKRYLRQLLWQLRAVTDAEGIPINRDLLLASPDCIRFNTDAQLWLDVEAFEEAYDRTRGVSGQTLDCTQAEALCAAAELYQGDLLEGWYEDWCLYERERLQNIYLTILDKLMDRCEACEAYETGLTYGALILRYDGARERTHRRLMRLQYLAGDRTTALRQYDRCVDALRRELAVRPAARTVRLYEQIRTGAPVASPKSPRKGASRPSRRDSNWSKILEQLRMLQSTLSSLQDQLEGVIGALESANGEHHQPPHH